MQAATGLAGGLHATRLSRLTVPVKRPQEIHVHNQTPLLQLTEDELVWISDFAEALRQLSPPLAADDQGLAADALARAAFEEAKLRSLPPIEAAQMWWEYRLSPSL